MWKWYEKNAYYPQISDMRPAPDSLLNMIRCACKSNCLLFGVVAKFIIYQIQLYVEIVTSSCDNNKTYDNPLPNDSDN